jgi:hypothetical protein
MSAPVANEICADTRVIFPAGRFFLLERFFVCRNSRDLLVSLHVGVLPAN